VLIGGRVLKIWRKRMSDGSTTRILPPRSTIVGGGDTKLPNNGEPKSAPTRTAGPIIGRAIPIPAAQSKLAAPESPEATPEKSIQADLREAAEAWRRYQATHDRDAVYGYLTAVYNVVMKWKREQRAWKSVGLALKLQGNAISMRVEPFAVVIRCTSAPDKVDGKTRSKWSRALRVAEAFKDRGMSVKALRRMASTHSLETCPSSRFVEHRTTYKQPENGLLHPYRAL
jgi:hypothetical protein